MQLLTIDNPKTLKGAKDGYATAILHLAPALLSGRNVCPHATKGCTAACLNTAGRGGIGAMGNRIQEARIARTMYFHNYRDGFLHQLVMEVDAFVRKCKKLDLKPAFRLNGTSDIPWEKFRVRRLDGILFNNIMEAFPHVQFYDYTKWPHRLRNKLPSNYHLTFSLSEHKDSDRRAMEWLANGRNVAAVVDVKQKMGYRKESDPMPGAIEIMGACWSMVDGDLSDLRFLDPSPVVVGLRAKGPAIKDASGFVRKMAA